MGMDQAQIATMIAVRDDGRHLSLPASMAGLVRLVAATAGQWRMVGGGMAPMRPVALDLTAVDIAARWLGLTPSPQLLDDLRQIEAEALSEMERDP